jgi:hypothetical protein
MAQQDIVDARPLAVSPPTLELLAWIREGERTYGETIDAWRSNCPRLSVWEDALSDRLVEVGRGRNGNRSTVVLTDRGLDALG